MLRIGLTGGIASGKSTVADAFAALGIEVIDTDEIAREVVKPGGGALEAIRARFGPGVIAADGTLDRRALRSLVFADAEKRRALEALLHPRIRERALGRADQSASPYVVIAVPLLFETGFDTLVDVKLVVDCPEPLQIARLTARDGIGIDEAHAMLAAQMARAERLARADDVIDNGGSLESTRRRVAELHSRYLELAQNCRNALGRAE